MFNLLLPERESNCPPQAAEHDGKLQLEAGVPGSGLRRVQLLETDDDITGSEGDLTINREAAVHPRPHSQHVVFVLLQRRQGTCGERQEIVRGTSETPNSGAEGLQHL